MFKKIKNIIKLSNKSDTPTQLEDVSEKRTSKLGYFLLILMVFSIVAFGQKVFDDLSDIPERPTAPSSCVRHITDTLTKDTSYGFYYKYDFWGYQDCPPYNGFNEVDKMFGIHTLFGAIEKEINTLKTLSKEIQETQNKIQDLEWNLNKLNDTYNLSLQERMANETEKLIDKAQIKAQITENQRKLEQARASLEKYQQEFDKIRAQIRPQTEKLAQTYEQAVDFYDKQMAKYKFFVFLLMLGFVLPFFAVSIYWYLRLKKQNSPYTIILAAVSGAFALLFLQVVFLFLYEILPRDWFERIFSILMSVPFMRYILYYLVAGLIITVFGGIVYYIQKKVFDPKRIAIKRLKENTCPNCSFSLHHQYKYCPNCGLQIKINCKSCRNLRIKELSYCPHCGAKTGFKATSH